MKENVWIKKISWLVWGLLAVLLLLLFSVFSRAWLLRQELQQQVALLVPLVTAEANQQATLTARLEYVQSDTYVEEWARTRAKMTQPGETLVIPVLPTPTVTPLPAPTATAAVTPTPLPLWQRWWQALRGEGR